MRSGMHGQSKFLGNGITENFHRPIRPNESCRAQRPHVVGPRIEETLQLRKTHDFVLDATRVDKSPELRLPTDKRRLTSFEAKLLSFACARLLPLRSTASRRPAACGIPACNALARSNGTPRWSESVKHGDRVAQSRLWSKERTREIGESRFRVTSYEKRKGEGWG